MFSAIKWILIHPAAEQYVIAALYFEGEIISEIEIKYKDYVG